MLVVASDYEYYKIIVEVLFNTFLEGKRHTTLVVIATNARVRIKLPLDRHSYQAIVL